GVGEGSQRLAQVPGQVGGEHADQHVAADAVLEPVPDGAQVQVVFEGPEVPLNAGQVLVGGHSGDGAELAGGDGGADDVDAVQGGLGVNGGLVPLPGQVPVADVKGEVLGDLVPVDDLSGAQADLVGVGQPAGVDGGLDLSEQRLGGGEQVLALAG